MEQEITKPIKGLFITKLTKEEFYKQAGYPLEESEDDIQTS